MSERRKKLLIKYGAAIAVCLVMAVAYLTSQDWTGADTRTMLRYLSDAFAIPGLLCVFVGLFIWLSNEGSLDGVGYVLSHAFHMLIPGNAHKSETYAQYLERKRGKKPMGFSFLLITGVISLAVSGVFLVIFHQY